MEHVEFRFGTVNVQPKDKSYCPWHMKNARFKPASVIKSPRWFGHAPTPLGTPNVWRAQPAF